MSAAAPHVTLPTGLTLQDWADQVALDLDRFGSFGRLDHPDNWQNWAMQFLNNTSLGRNFPLPYDFADWREWAERFVQILA
jgi:hypothetical protein